MDEQTNIKVIYGYFLNWDKLNFEDIMQFNKTFLFHESRRKLCIFDVYRRNDFLGMKFNITKISESSPFALYEIPDTNELYKQFLQDTTEDERNNFFKFSALFHCCPKFMVFTFVTV